MKRRFDWSLNRAFASIDVARDGFVTFSSLLNFFRLNGYNALESELIAIVRRLDCNADQRISFDEFRLVFGDDCPSMVQPASPRREAPYSTSALKSNSPLRQTSPRSVRFEERKSSPKFRDAYSSPKRLGKMDANTSPLRSRSP